MNDLVEFLTARLDHAQETAESAGESRIAWLTYLNDDGRLLYTTVADGHGGVWVADGKELPEPSTVLVVYDTAEVLADIAAKRRIIAEIVPLVTDMEATICGEWGGIDDEAAEPLLRLLAQPYAGHPEYNPSWTL